MKRFKNKNTGDVVKYINEIYYMTTEEIGIPKRFIENSCDWEEVEKEKTYEVLSMINIDKNIISYEDSDNTYDSVDEWVEYFLKSKIWSIHSVKRLSDGEIFTIGDKVTWGIDRESKFEVDITFFHLKRENVICEFTNGIYGGISIFAPNFRKIEVDYPLFYDELKDGEYYTTTFPNQGIYLFKQGCKLWRKGTGEIITSNKGNFTPSNGFNNFRKATEEEIKLLSSPLFKTEDGVEIFKGDSYHCVNTAPHLWSLFEQTAKEKTMLNKGVKAFSTEELAKEYKLMNQPLLSLNKLLSVWGNEDEIPFYETSRLFVNFKRIAENKLNEKS